MLNAWYTRLQFHQAKIEGDALRLVPRPILDPETVHLMVEHALLSRSDVIKRLSHLELC